MLSKIYILRTEYGRTAFLWHMQTMALIRHFLETGYVYVLIRSMLISLSTFVEIAFSGSGMIVRGWRRSSKHAVIDTLYQRSKIVKYLAFYNIGGRIRFTKERKEVWLSQYEGRAVWHMEHAKAKTTAGRLFFVNAMIVNALFWNTYYRRFS